MAQKKTETDTIVILVILENAYKIADNEVFYHVLNKIKSQYKKDSDLVRLYEDVVSWSQETSDDECHDALLNLKTTLEKSGLLYSIVITNKMEKTGDNSKAMIIHFLDERDGGLSCGTVLDPSWQIIQVSEKNFDLITCPECLDKYLSILQE